MPPIEAPETPEVDDRRSAIEAAFEASETPVKEPAQAELPLEEPEKQEKVEEQVEPKSTDEKSVVATPAETDVAVPEKAPQAWKATTKAKWDALDPEVRQEVLRREHQISTTLNETAGMRQFATQFHSAVQPYSARFAEAKMEPAEMVGTLLKIDHVLATGTPTQRAQQVAAIINSAGVDIDMLADALSGKTSDPVSAQVEQLLQQRLQPFQAFMSQQEQAAKAAAEAENQRVTAEVQAMSDNPKFPHFTEVRDTMADLIEIAAKKNTALTIESAYNKAVKMMDLDAETIARNAAAEANAKAQRALKASKSVSGAPRTAMLGSPASTDRRSIIEAAFNQVGDR